MPLHHTQEDGGRGDGGNVCAVVGRLIGRDYVESGPSEVLKHPQEPADGRGMKTTSMCANAGCGASAETLLALDSSNSELPRPLHSLIFPYLLLATPSCNPELAWSAGRAGMAGSRVCGRLGA